MIAPGGGDMVFEGGFRGIRVAEQGHGRPIRRLLVGAAFDPPIERGAPIRKYRGLITPGKPPPMAARLEKALPFRRAMLDSPRE